jgi:hypothetical protein
MEGAEVCAAYKGRRFKIAPEADQPFDRLSRMTPLEVINPDGPGIEDESWKDEMRLARESDWADL